MPNEWDIALNLIDTGRYPIDQPGSPDYEAAVAAARGGLDQDGCARIDGYIRADKRDELAAETRRLVPQALFSSQPYTPYGTPPDESFSSNHPRRRTHRTTSGNVTKDLIPEAFAIKTLYRSPHFQSFIADCLDAEEIFEFADPMRGLTINAMQDGSYLGWHFDANEFVVSLMTKRSDQGGIFNYCPGIRAPGNENYAAVEAVLDGKQDLVKSLELRPGDLQIFKGRYSMHEVTTVTGDRHTVLFGYAREPGFIGSVESTMRVYGRVMQAHIDAENTRNADGLAD